MTDYTSIGLFKETKERLDAMKVYRRETYDDIINRVLDEAFESSQGLDEVDGRQEKN